MADILQYLHSLDEPVKEKLLKLFASMPGPLRERCAVQNLKKGDILASPLDPADFVYVLVHGSIQTANQDSSGNIYVVAEFTAPSLFGEFELIAGYPFYRGTLTATSDCRIITIGQETYLAWVQGNGEVLFQRARAVTRRLLEQSSNERNFLSLRATERLMFLLCRYYERDAKDGTVRICATRQKMADEINTSLKTVIRGIQQLKKWGLVCMEGHGISVRREGYQRMKTLLEKEYLSCPPGNNHLDFNEIEMERRST
ncbi:MAG: Crp/Fnr family transcriptional regulator [Ruminococcaceae bacterium]|nr:Crp/Fnr family transcriptional regulator [Oscillospiraceae bacterium]